MSRTEMDKMLSGELYRPASPEMHAELKAARAWLAPYNQSFAATDLERHALLRERLAGIGDGTAVRPPFKVDRPFLREQRSHARPDDYIRS
jgi:maltose O-acetyltransferase